MSKIVVKDNIEYSLEDLPVDKVGHIDWKNSVGHVIKFTYKDICGKISITGYEENTAYQTRLTIEYMGTKKTIFSSSVLSAIGLKELVIGANLRKTKNVGDIITSTTGKKFMVVGVSVRKEKNTGNKSKFRPYYKLRCLDCGEEIVVNTRGLVRPPCYVCSNQKIRPGYNDIATTDPWMVPYFQNEEDATKYSSGSSARIIPKCPVCGTIHDKEMEINMLRVHHGFRCKVCNDNISFPEKVMISILRQLKINFHHEADRKVLPFFCGERRYDFYLKEYSCIIETHGIQHYEDTLFRGYWSYAKDNQEIDREKYEYAKKNVENYVVLDCRKSEIDWIKNSIKHSILPKLLSFDIDDIDWEQCLADTATSMNKEVCDDYRNNYMTVIELAEKYNKCKATIQKMLTLGAKLGWCTYSRKINTYKNPVEILIRNTNIHVAYGKSPSDLSNKLRKYINPHSFGQSNIAKALRVRNGVYDKYVIRYIDDIGLKWEILEGKYDNELCEVRKVE